MFVFSANGSSFQPAGLGYPAWPRYNNLIGEGGDADLNGQGHNGYGQFIRSADPQVEENHYHNHTGDWPHPSRQEWLQWTASPPNIADLDLDGRNEIVGVPNIEFNVPYETQAYAVNNRAAE